VSSVHNRPLRVLQLIATRHGDPERGPAVWLHPDEAQVRLIVDGELVWVYGPRRHELATAYLDGNVPRGAIVLRDVVGASPSEVITISKVDTDTPPRRETLA
jgi:anaerobic selenocysteine-containing dehydrogenase